MYNKQGNIRLETSAHVSNRQDTDITFFNTDIGTAKLVFLVTRNRIPLLVSENNVESYIILKSAENYIVDDVNVKDAMNGVLSYTVPSDFLSVANQHEVEGQVYLAVKGKEDIITQVNFTFHVKDSVINSLPAVDKLREIRTFHEFKKSITDAIKDINESLENSKDYAEELENIYKLGLKQLQNKNDNLEENITSFANNKEKEFDSFVKDQLDTLKTTSENIQSDIKALNQSNTTNWQKHKLTNEDGTIPIITGVDFNNLDDFVTKTTNFYAGSSLNQPSGANANGYVSVFFRNNGYAKLFYSPYSNDEVYTKRRMGNNGWTAWKHLTEEPDYTPDYSDMLNREYIGELKSSVFNLGSGYYEAIIPSDPDEVDAPVYPNGGSYVASIDVFEGERSKVIRLIQNEVNQEFLTTVTPENNNVWKQNFVVEDYNSEFYDLGWIPFETRNGFVKRGEDDEHEIDNGYRVFMDNGIEKVAIRINLSNITTNTTACYLPEECVKKRRHFYLRTPVSKNPAICYIGSDGAVYVYLNMEDRESWSPTDYVVGEYQYILN